MPHTCRASTLLWKNTSSAGIYIQADPQGSRAEVKLPGLRSEGSEEVESLRGRSSSKTLGQEGKAGGMTARGGETNERLEGVIIIRVRQVGPF